MSNTPEKTSSEEGARTLAYRQSDDEIKATKDVERDGGEKISSNEVVNLDAQRGVQQVEAMTINWTRSQLAIAYALMFCLYTVNAFQSSITGNLSPFVVSGFELHSLLPVINIVASVMAAATYMPVSKILDLWGRAEGFSIMALFATLGLILLACTTNIQTYCAAQCFYSIGFAGLIYTIDVVTADTSKLKNRGIAFALTSSPYMITAFAGPKAAESFYEQISWRWAYGVFAIILPFVAVPFAYLIHHQQKKATGLIRETSTVNDRTWVQGFWHYCIQFDAVGVILSASGLVVLLLPFSLAASAPNGWGSGYIIAMLVVGGVVCVAFALWECYLAPVPFLPWHLLTNRTVIGILILDVAYQISYYCWDGYFSSFLQVVNDLSIATAGYVGNTFDVVSGILLFIVGYAIRRTGNFKIVLWAGVPLYILGMGLMIHFRTAESKVGYVVMCQVFIAIAGACIIIAQQVGILAAVDHQYIAASLALLNSAGYVGGAIGSAISGAIWTNTFPGALARYLPEESLPDLEDILNDLTVQLSYPIGDATRIGIQQGYGFSQKYMLIGGISFMSLALLSLFIIKNINLHKIQQTKGVLF